MWAATIAATALVIGTLVPSLSAAAAGPAVVSTTVDVVNVVTGAPIAELQSTVADRSGPATASQFALNVSYSCGPQAPCQGTVIKIDPQQLDPYYGTYRFATYLSVTLPTGATIASTATAGQTITLGNLPAGATGSFAVVYTFAQRGGGVSPNSFFPDNTTIGVGATISATNSDASQSATDSVNWRIVTPAPGVLIAPTPVARVDTDYTYTLYMSASCTWERSIGNYGAPESACAKSYKVVDTLPAGAIFVSATDGGVYSAATNTVTWEKSGAPAASGWGSLNVFGPPRTVTVRFPASMVTNPAACVLTVQTRLATDVTYLDGAVKSTSADRSHTVNACPEFASAEFVSKTTSRQAGTVTDPVVFAGAANYWQVDVLNRSNVPGVATVVDNALDQANLAVYQITLNSPADITYTLDNGTTATAVGVTSYTAPTGRRIVASTIVSQPLVGPNTVVGSQPLSTRFQIRYAYTPAGTLPAGGVVRTNTASASMAFPTSATLAPLDLGQKSASVRVINAAVFNTAITRTVAGGGSPVAGTLVTFQGGGTTSSMLPDVPLEPQYVFVAPYQWEIKPGSASIAGATDFNFVYKTVVIAGETRQAVYASRPAGTVWGVNSAWPLMTVVASPTPLAPAGSLGTATMYSGEAGHLFDKSSALYKGSGSYDWGVADLADLDGDGVTTEIFDHNTIDTPVGAASEIRVLKEICQPDASVAGGCLWLSDPSTAVAVAPDATDIKYRVTITNAGNSALAGIVAYDVLPHLFDHGTSAASATIPRGSTFEETVSAASSASPSLTLAYSASTNPCRPEVFPGGPAGCDSDWNSSASGKKSIKASLLGTLSAGSSVSFTYTANVVGTPAAGEIACNSVAVDSSTTPVSEPRPVCATTAAADLTVGVKDRLPLKVGRPGVAEFTVANLGGTTSSPAKVRIALPANLVVTSFQPAGWSCVAVAGGAAPLTGPAALDCIPVDAGGAERPLLVGAPESLALPVTPLALLAGEEVCVTAAVSGPLFDAVLGNNTASSCTTVVSGANLEITKDDGRSVVAVGDTYTYTLTATNRLVSESLDSLLITDVLPAGLEFVSASDGGTESAGVVSWPLIGLAAAGVPSAGGGAATGAAGSSVIRTVTVRVLPAVSGAVTNTANVSAPDPADATKALTATATDTDQLRKLSVSKASSAPTSGVRAGDTVTYTVTVTNVGTEPYAQGAPAVVRDDLTAVLDDATFVTGSASVSVNGGSPSAVPNPSAGVLSWSGALAVGKSAVLTYSVLVGDGTAGDAVLKNVAFISAVPANSCDVATGLDLAGLACAATEDRFAPTLAKSIISATQGDDGRWTIVYGLDVVNLNASGPVTYNLSDSLLLGAGISKASASVTSSPVGVTPASWSGTGAVASSAVIPAGGAHHYEVTVIANAGAVGGTAAATCVTGVAGGFANSATLTPQGGSATSAWACASPVEPEVAKSVAAPVQNADGTWTVEYTVTVTAPTGAPATGLAYTLDDTFAFPAGVTVRSVVTSSAGDVPLNASFNGAATSRLLSGVDRVVPGEPRVITVAVVTDVRAGAVLGSEAACAPSGSGGYANGVTLFSGTSATVLDEASACERVTAQPTPEITKSVASTSVDGDTGEWTIVYALTVTNPSATLATTYSLKDELQYGAGIVVHGATVGSTDATTSSTWNGTTDAAIVSDEPLSGGAVHTYNVTVVASPPSVTDANAAAMDCRLDSGESGTGFRNLATLSSGTVSAFAVGCEAATDPSVVKTTVSNPVQDPTTGVWTIVYDITVKNRSTSTASTGIPYSLTDRFGFPAGTQVLSVNVDAPASAAVNAAFDGDGESALATASIGAAANEDTPATQVYTVTVEFVAPSGLSASDRACDPAQGAGGLRNEVEVAVGPRVTGDVACAELPDVPVAGVAKELLSQSQLSDGTWEVLYRITVGNPDPSVTTIYDLDDEFALGQGIQLDSAAITAAPAGVVINHGTFNGGSASRISENVVLPGGASHQYTVRAVIDAGSVASGTAAGNCILEPAEAGTGFMNRVLVSTGGVERVADACATPLEPTVAKTVSGVPVRNADGSWTVAYTVVVQNPSQTVPLAYGLTDELGFPDGTVFDDAQVVARTGSPAASSVWDGVDELTIVEEGSALPGAATHVFDVTVRATLPAGQGSLVDGWANSATVASSTGGDVTSDAGAAADIELPELTVTKSSDADAVVRIGDTVTYTVHIENSGAGAFTSIYPAVVWDDLAGVLDDATLAGTPVLAPVIGSVETSDGRLRWSGALAVGQSLDLSYEVTVTGEGDQILRNVAFAGLPGEIPETPTTCEGDGCAVTTSNLPGFMLEKSASTGVATAGDQVEYTITYTNTGLVDVADATFTDDLSGVLDDAMMTTAAAASSGVATLSSGTLTWEGALAAGESVTVTYAVTINPVLSGDGKLINAAISDPDFATRWPGGVCPNEAEVCDPPASTVEVETGIRSLAFTKAADSTRAAAGKKVSYTVTVTNIGAVAYTQGSPATIVDSMQGVLDDARYNADVSVEFGAVTFANDRLTWVGALDAGQTITFTYSVTVNDRATGDGKMSNIIGIAGTSQPFSGLNECLPDVTDNAQAYCVVTTTIEPLATTGALLPTQWILVGLLILLIGTVFVLLAVVRRRREAGEHA